MRLIFKFIYYLFICSGTSTQFRIEQRASAETIVGIKCLILIWNFKPHPFSKVIECSHAACYGVNTEVYLGMNLLSKPIRLKKSTKHLRIPPDKINFHLGINRHFPSALAPLYIEFRWFDHDYWVIHVIHFHFTSISCFIPYAEKEGGVGKNHKWWCFKMEGVAGLGSNKRRFKAFEMLLVSLFHLTLMT